MKNIDIAECSLRDTLAEMDFDRVTAMLAKAFWCEGIGKEEVLKGARNSALVVGVFFGNLQIGYARVISDKTRFAYLLDVIVDEEYRYNGVGQYMVRSILDHPELSDVYQWMLITKDAHELYRKMGFSEVSRPKDLMEIRHRRAERIAEAHFG
jgi:ribosomal protein S18 acetylase RimI-like enzyme